MRNYLIIMEMNTINIIYNRIKGLMNLKKLGCAAFLIFSFSQSLIFLTSCVDTVILPDNKTVDEEK